MAVGLSVTYDNGDHQELRATAMGLVAAERKWKGEPPKVEGTFYACWWGSKARTDGIEFQTWLESVADFDELKESNASPPPETSPES
jgi:hypothetical protein